MEVFDLQREGLSHKQVSERIAQVQDEGEQMQQALLRRNKMKILPRSLLRSFPGLLTLNLE